MLSFVIVKLLLKIENFNYSIITHKLLSLKYDLIFKQNWLRHYNLNINWKTSMMKVIDVKHKMHMLLSFNLRQHVFE